MNRKNCEIQACDSHAIIEITFVSNDKMWVCDRHFKALRNTPAAKRKLYIKTKETK